MSNLINKSNLDDNSDNETTIERLFPKCRPRSMVSKSKELTEDDNHLIDQNYDPLKLEDDALVYFSKSEVERQEDNDQHLRFRLNQNEDEVFKINSIHQPSNCDYNQSHARLIKEIGIGDHQIASQNDGLTMRMEARDYLNENKLELKESKIPMYGEKEVVGYRWNSLSASPQNVSKKSASSQFQNGCVEMKQNSEDMIFLNRNKQYSTTSFHPLNISQDGLIQNSKLWGTTEYISTSSLPKSIVTSNSSVISESSISKPNLLHSNHFEDSCYQDTFKLDQFESNANCDDNNFNDNNVQLLSKSRNVTRSLSLPSLLDYSQKLTFDVLKCQNEIKNERQKESQQFLASLETNELKATGNETMYIGNVPIARYDESPRRYRPKQPGSAQRAVLNGDESSQSQSPFKVSLDELVKSILNISLSPLPSPSEESINNCNSTLQLGFNLNEDRCDKDLINIAVVHEVDQRLSNLDDVNNQTKKSVPYTVSGQGSNVLRKSGDLIHSQGVVKVSDQLASNLKDLHQISEKVHQNYPLNKKNNKEENSHIYETMVEDQNDDSKNFIQISPETSDCDSNDNESESVSLEGSLYFSSRHNKMPVLEDGLSSGHSSSDGELEEETPALNIRDPRKTAESSYEPSAQVNLNNQKINSSQNCDYHYHQKYHPPGQICHNHGSLSNYSKTNREEVKCKFNIPRSKSLQLNHYPNQPVPVSHADVNSCEVSWSQRNNSNQAAKGSIKSTSKMQLPKSKLSENSGHTPSEDDCDTDQETDRLLGAQRSEERSYLEDKSNSLHKKKNSSREVLIEGILFRARYLGSTQLICEGQPTKATRMMQAEEAVSRIKSLAPEGETQPSTEVDLFISTEKIMVLNTDLKEIMMDHALRTISYIADIGDLLVLMTRRRIINQNDEHPESKIKRVPKMICHIFESEEAQFIAQSIGQAFQVAYMEFLKANGIEDSSFVKEMDYQEVLNSQEIFGNELEMFAKKDRQKEVIVPKQKGEILGLVIVESGWGSMLPTVVIANISQQGPAARCGHLNIGDQIIAINGVSLVGLPLTTCQNYIKNTWPQTAVKLTVVPCGPVVEVKIKRPDTKYQLGFSVQNGVICSLLRGGIAERGGVRVGHRIIEINRQSVVAVPHERIVNLLATSIGEIVMKTMPTSMFRLLTGQETRSFI